MNSFRLKHLFPMLALFERADAPLDLFLSHYFRSHPSVGAHDRRWIAETIYGMVRWRGTLDHLSPKPLSWERRLEVFLKLDKCSLDHLPPHIRVSFPKYFFQLLETSYGLEKAIEICLSSNTRAPLTLRANGIKIERDALLEQLNKQSPASPTKHSPWGIQLDKRINLFGLQEFKDGLFEVQDEASQLAALLVEPRGSMQILDFCAGSGGKSLAFAPLMRGKGQLYLHDIRPQALEEAKKRLRRAGVQNSQIVYADDPNKEALRGRMDYVFVDAPCSGSGTLRRNPDMKWKFEQKMVEELIAKQRTIFKEALSFLGPDGTIIYATCSLLPEENQKQAAYFQENFGVEQVGDPFCSFPTPGGMDGFFAARFKKKPSH